MKNVICIDLTKFNKEKLAQVAVFYKLDVATTLSNKEKGFVKLFIDLNTNQIIAHTSKKDKSITYTDTLGEILQKITPVDPIVKKEKVMDVDTILDKIGKYGVDSLSINEKAFLDKSIK